MPESGFYWMGPKEGGVVVLCRFPTLAAARAHFAAAEGSAPPLPPPPPPPSRLPVPVAPPEPRPPRPPVVRTGVCLFTPEQDLEILEASLAGEASLEVLAREWRRNLTDLNRRRDQIDAQTARDMKE